MHPLSTLRFFIKVYNYKNSHLGPHVQRVGTHKKVAYTLFHINDQMYQERNDRGNVRCLTQIPGLSYALFYSY